MNTTILIPTYNRPQKLARALDFYQSGGIPVAVADGSEEAYTGTIPSNALYHHLPSVGFFPRMMQVLNNITTPHVVLAPDDDFILPKFIQHADEWLTQCPEFSAVFGRCYIFKEIDSNEWNQVVEWARPIEQNTLSLRLQTFFSRYYPLFYVPTRTELLREVFSAFAEYPTSMACLVEIMLAVRLVIAGKIALLDELYTAREEAEVRWHPSTYPSVPELVAKDAGLIDEMDLLVSQWIGKSEKGIFNKDILRPYEKVFVPWYRKRGRTTRLKELAQLLLGKRVAKYRPAEAFQDFKELMHIQQIILLHGAVREPSSLGTHLSGGNSAA